MHPPANDNPARLSTLTSLALTIGAMRGWWRNLAALLFGVCVTLALPPYHLLPVLVVGLCGLYWLVVAAPRPRRIALDGWWFGYGMFASGLYWITNALFVDADQFGWLAPFALIGIPGGLALYISLACLMFYRFRRVGGFAGVWFFAFFWLCAEGLRGHMLTGFPWGLIGYAWSFSETTLQFYSFFGIYITGFLTVLLALLPGMLTGSSRPAARYASLGLLTGAVALLFLGYARISDAPHTEVEGIRLRLVQPAIEQTLKWDPEYLAEGLQKLATLSLSAGHEKITHIIWPESAMPFPFQSGDLWATRLAELVPPGGALITGVTRTEGSVEAGNMKIFNSIQAVDAQAQVIMAYDKVKLVPFGEFVPLRTLLPIEKITHGTLDFSPGKPGLNYSVQTLPPLRPLICYESIFPKMTGGERPEWLLNVTNDAWFGDSSGPYQHLEMARARAVEQGVPLIRVANTGISAAVDAYGRMLQQLPLGVAGVLDVALPQRLPATFYALYADYLLLLLAAISLLLLCLLKKQQEKNVSQ